METVLSAAIIKETEQNGIDEAYWDKTEPDAFPGNFGDADGYDCRGYEQGGGKGGGKRILKVDCTKIIKPKKKKGKPTKLKRECYYEGNPHHCSWYNTKNNQPIFYQKLLEKLEKNPGGACAAASVSIKKCKNVVFTKIGLGERFTEERIRINTVEIDKY